MITCEVIFRGRVQGVGFRYTARDLAREAGLTGWVKNLSDGSVQLVLEGDELAIEGVIGKLEEYFTIREKKVVRSPARSGYTDMTIKY